MITVLDILIFAVPTTIAVYMYQLPLQATVNPLLSPLWNLFFPSTFEGGGGLKERGGLFNFNSDPNTSPVSSKNTVVSDRVDLHVVQ